MSRKNDAWGIEVGANAIKAMRLSRAGSEVELKDFEILPFKQILTTPDIDIDEMIQVGLDSLLAKHDLSRSTVVVSVPGHMGFARFAKLPPVEPKKIPDIVRFEAVQQIPFPIEQVEWDYQVFQQADSPDVEVGIFAITKERVVKYLSNFRQVNLRVDALTQSPIAVYNAFSYDRAEEDDDGVIYMDIGTRSTDVIIAEQGQILPRTLPIGGNHFTEALVKAFKLSFPKAEKLKREAGTSKYARQIFQAMRPVFADLVQELQRSLGYYQSINRDANLTKLIGVGSTFRLPGLQKFLKQQLQIEVIRPESYHRIAAEGKREAEFAEHALNMATAYGLALQGLGMDAVSANLLPRNILTQRMWRAKQPWFAAAAACAAVAAGAMTANHFMAVQGAGGSEEQAAQRIAPVLNVARQNESKWREVDSGADPRGQIENLRRILDYRDVWPKLLEDLSLATNAVNPQEATLTADYAAIREIPRNQRRRIFIESVDAEYIVEAASTGSGTSSRGRARGASGGPGADVLGRTYAVSDFFPETTANDGFTTSTSSSTKRPPRFLLTVRGTTPHSEGAAFVTQNLIGWLQENAERLDRPYRLVISSTPFVSMDQIQADPVDRNLRGRTPARTAPRPGTTGRRDMVGMEFDDIDMLGGRGIGSTRTGRTGRTGMANLEDLLPAHPLEAEGRVGDWRFEIQWELELLPPHLARQEQRPAPQQEEESENDADQLQAREGEAPASDERAQAEDQPARTREEAQS